MILSIVPSQVAGLPKADQINLQNLINTWQTHEAKNQQKNKYYEGNIKLIDVYF